ncbi:unnamed protein product [Zymoseptoria tritici ST99CH_1A5]|nr:uncharacterized protein MYCGRDRAFT_102657 [Zymoseptoria tritici IPO323]EGP92177.1 hypothetical protein MYCGRDRAFT_102657 [Zymoseptoria tritici IPO323]SMR42605.1 unnamed protein product [Zymoseptoria tritici ST99CH_1E4]SMY19944.1 unnamed protein product [Zymoseptoria tritici ST99CH_1A5]
MSYAPRTESRSEPEPKNENPGLVTSDSLAAESVQEGGTFAENSSSRIPSDQPSASSTANTTDTSNATRLDPAPDADARLTTEEWSEESQLNAGRSLGSQGSDGGSTFETTGSSGRGSTFDTTRTSDELPQSKPKGQNLTEGGIDAGAPNASFTTDIGGKGDPGRVALGDIEASNTPYAGGVGERQTKITGDGQFDSLDRDTSA